MRLEDITPESLAEVSRLWDEKRIHDLVRDSMIGLGKELRKTRAAANNVEVRAKIRALKLHNEYEFTKKEIASLLGLDTREINKWLK